ncbi:MAG: 30S ribosomal protein S20 [Deltaproteobacteria bacterium]|nr:30S ribosomal protein S20 [Deltaproteobacteria bacterium]
MANHPSAEKRHRQSVKRAARNQGVRTRVRSSVKKARTLIESGDKAAAGDAVRLAQKTLDKAVSKGVLHRKNASRRLARLARQAFGLS